MADDTTTSALDLDGLAAGKPPPDDKPPKPTRKRASTGRPRGRPKSPKRQRDDLANELTGLFGMIGSGLLAAGLARPSLTYDGEVILKHADDLAGALADAAQKNPALQKVLDAMLTTTSFGQLAGVVSLVAVPILANHGVLPPAAAVLVGAPPIPVRHEADPTAPSAADLDKMFGGGTADDAPPQQP